MIYPEIPIGNRDDAVLGVIQEEGLTSFTFDGLRRRTGAHPETLSRILNRLEERGVILRVSEGYTVTPNEREVVSAQPLGKSGSYLPVLRTLLPYDVNVREVIAGLKGRWFGTLRWMGDSEDEDGTTLKWIVQDGAVQLDARFSNGELTIEAKVIEGGEAADAIKAAHQLVGHISRSYLKPRRRVIPRVQSHPSMMPA